MTDPRTLAAALVLSTSASASTVPHAAPIPVYDGLLMYPDPLEGRHAFGPADGLDYWLGKGKSDQPSTLVVCASEAPLWRASQPQAAQHTTYRPDPHHTAIFNPPLPPLCCTRGPRIPPMVPETPHAPVPLPGAVWMLLAGLAGLILTRRRNQIRCR